MPLQDTDYELIDKHLLGRLDQVTKKAFAQRKRDKDFQKELAWRKEMQLVFKKRGRQDLKSRLQAMEQNNTKIAALPKNKPSIFLKWKY